MNKHHLLYRRTRVVLLFLMGSLPLPIYGMRERSAHGQSITSPLTDGTLPDAISLWLENRGSAERTYGGPIGGWDTSEITNMDSLFRNEACKVYFDQDLSQWDVSKVTSMHYTFAGCEDFNSHLNDWDVSKVTSMMGIFNGASSFNQDLDRWNTAKVTDMTSAFKGASNFNAKLHGWETSKVTSMEMMFYGTTFFEDIHNSLEDWDVSNVVTMTKMFSSATRFNGNLSRWNPKSVQSFVSMFAYATSFDPESLNDWDMSSASFLDRMFYRAVKFQAEICWESLASSDVSGVEMLCGSSVTFDPDCNEPYGTEDCPEAYAEMEEDYGVREAYHQDQQPLFESPIRGGAGGVGAMNPGAHGRDTPESTARLDGGYYSNDAPIIDEEPIEERAEPAQPPTSTYDFKLGPLAEGSYNSDGTHPESVVIQARGDSSSGRRNESLPFLLLLAAAFLLSAFLL